MQVSQGTAVRAREAFATRQQLPRRRSPFALAASQVRAIPLRSCLIIPRDTHDLRQWRTDLGCIPPWRPRCEQRCRHVGQSHQAPRSIPRNKSKRTWKAREAGRGASWALSEVGMIIAPQPQSASGCGVLGTAVHLAWNWRIALCAAASCDGLRDAMASCDLAPRRQDLAGLGQHSLQSGG